MNTCIYPGSFDPFTNGHLDILRRGARLFDRVIVAVLHNSAKRAFFSLDERMEMIRRAVEVGGIAGVTVETFDGLLIGFAKTKGAAAIIRGLRAVSDFEYEMQLANMNKSLEPEIETVFLMAGSAHTFLSSSIVKEVGTLGGDISPFVPAVNFQYVTERLLTK